MVAARGQDGRIYRYPSDVDKRLGNQPRGRMAMIPIAEKHYLFNSHLHAAPPPPPLARNPVSQARPPYHPGAVMSVPRGRIGEDAGGVSIEPQKVSDIASRHALYVGLRMLRGPTIPIWTCFSPNIETCRNLKCICAQMRRELRPVYLCRNLDGQCMVQHKRARESDSDQVRVTLTLVGVLSTVPTSTVHSSRCKFLILVDGYVLYVLPLLWLLFYAG